MPDSTRKPAFCRRTAIAALLGLPWLAAGGLSPAPAQAQGYGRDWNDHREWREDHREWRDHDREGRRDFRERGEFRERSSWREGRWQHGWHEGRYGWWWVAPGFDWSYYPAPVYPYPEPYAVAPAAPPAPPAASYYCANPPGYYPYVQQCYTGWQPLPPG